MSRHVARKERWTRQDAKTYVSDLGRVAYLHDGWYALLEYRMQLPPEREGGMPSWQPTSRRLGPFKQSRNAMVALEREVAFLKNRNGKEILFGDQLWAEA